MAVKKKTTKKANPQSEEQKKYEARVSAIRTALEAAADETQEHPALIQKQKFQKHAKGTVTEWDLRSVGGFAAIKKELFPLSDEDLALNTKNKIVGSYVTKLENNVGSEALFRKTMLETCLKGVKELKIAKGKAVPKPRIKSKGIKMTMEAMLSDLHYGKKTKQVNLKVLRERMQEFRDVFLFEMQLKEKSGFDVEKLIIAIIGDIIESFTMHGMESAMSSEFGNAEQVQWAITSIYEDFLLPIAMTGKKIHCPCVAGNHDRVERDKTFNSPGKTYMSWIIYNTLEQLCRAQGLKNVTFDIPEESFTVYSIYGSNVLYEHTDKVKSPTKVAFENLMLNRQRQLKMTIHMLRGGHWHEYTCFDRGRIIINESLPGPDSYAIEKGYVSTSGQVINFYVDTKNRPTSFYYSFPVYLG
jgi:hypothetical protein